MPEINISLDAELVVEAMVLSGIGSPLVIPRLLRV